MSYKSKIYELASQTPKSVIDFDAERRRGRAPTQAFSEFLTNREQGDWAERLVLTALNETYHDYVAVQYGRSDNLVAGDEGFSEFYEQYQDELDKIGKRPDLLVFKKDDYEVQWNYNISRFPEEDLNLIVPKAIAGLEIRSSSFLIDKYDAEMKQRFETAKEKILRTKQRLICDFGDVFNAPQRSEYLKLLNSINEDNLRIISFRVPGWSANERVKEAKDLFKEIKESIKEIQKRDFLSITPKEEDIKIVYKWIQTYDVPHYYLQVFFDKIYGISFENVLKLINDSDREEIDYYIEDTDTKNQNKKTIKINAKIGEELAGRVTMPDHESKMRELGRGRLLFYVTFEGGKAYFSMSNFLKLLNIQKGEFIDET